jgi:hypothetical protein
VTSFAGIQREITPEALGRAPASPTPKRKRTRIRESKPVVAPVKNVNKDHHKTILVKTIFWPLLSPKIPEGISNKA